MLPTSLKTSFLPLKSCHSVIKYIPCVSNMIIWLYLALCMWFTKDLMHGFCVGHDDYAYAWHSFGDYMWYLMCTADRFRWDISFTVLSRKLRWAMMLDSYGIRSFDIMLYIGVFVGACTLLFTHVHLWLNASISWVHVVVWSWCVWLGSSLPYVHEWGYSLSSMVEILILLLSLLFYYAH